MKSAIKNQYILIDYENVQVKSLSLLQDKPIQVRVFLGPSNTKLSTDLVLAMKDLGERADYILLDAGGHNALDFHIAYYLGKLSAVDMSANFYVISKDKGFDSLIAYINKNGVSCTRAVSIADLPIIKKSAASNAALKVFSSAKPTAKAKAQPTQTTLKKQPAATLANLVLANLEKRKGSTPRTVKTLMSTIKTLCGEQYNDKEVDAVFKRLLKLKYVVMNGEKISYQLPVDDE